MTISSSTIGHTDNTNLLTLGATSLSINKDTTVTGKISATTLNIGGIDITSTASDLNKLSTVSSSADELNILNGVTGVSSTNINQLANVTSNIATFMGDVYTKSEADAKYAIKDVNNGIIEVGALESGSIINTFGSIDIGTSALTAGSITGNNITIDNILIDGSRIGHVDDVDLINLASGTVNINGTVSASSLETTDIKLGGVSITSSAADLNKLKTVTASDAELNILDGVTSTTTEINVLSGAEAGKMKQGKAAIYEFTRRS